MLKLPILVEVDEGEVKEACSGRASGCFGVAF